MSTNASNFISQFYSFEGITIGERRKELFTLLRQHDHLKNKDGVLLEIYENLKPQTYLQKKFFVEILIYFRSYQELYKVFLGEDEASMRPLWKQSWFFKSLVQKHSNESLVQELFKQLSYVTRLRFLRNIIHYISDEERLDEFYDVVYKKYGCQNANHVLAGCSLNKIIEILRVQDIRFKFSNKDIIFLHQYKKNHIVELMKLENARKLFDFYDYNSKSFAIIAGYDMNFFFDVFKDNVCCNIGRRLTKKLFRLKREYIIDKVSTIYPKLHRRTFLKELKSDFKKFFFDTWPKSFKSFHIYRCMKFMRYYPKDKYIELIQEGSQHMYGKSLSELPEFIVRNIRDEMLDNIKDVEIRESLLEVLMMHRKDDYTLPQYYRIGKSIPLLKKKISAADGVRTRKSLVECLVKTCKINNDTAALLEVMKYFNFRHRNDSESIRSSFLTEIIESFDLTYLTASHWEFILELIEWSKIKNENYWDCGKVYILHIKFLFKNRASKEIIDNLLHNYSTDLVKCLSSVWENTKDISELHEYLLLFFINESSCVKDDEDMVRFYFQLFEAILDWNKRYPSKQIDFMKYSHILESIPAKLKDGSNSASLYMRKFITGEIYCNEQFYEELERLFWENFFDYFNIGLVEYFLRKKPLKIVEHFKKFITIVFKRYSCESLCMWRLVKHYDHLKLPELTLDYLKKNELNTYVGSMEGIALGTLMDLDEYMRLIPVPQFERLNIDDEEQSHQYRLCDSLLRYLKYLNASSILPYIVHFCKGDHLQAALQPLYYYFFHSAENRHVNQLEILSTRAVSVRKHAVKIACSVSPISIASQLIKQMTESEKNQSAIEHLFHKTLKYFLIEQSEELWALLKLQMSCLDILESHAFENVCDIGKLPRKYKMLVFQIVWELLDKSENEGHDVAKLKENLLKSLNEDIFKELPYEFCSSLIKNKFMRFNENYKIIYNFVLNCLKYGMQSSELVEDVFNVIREFKNNYILHQEFDISRKSRLYLSDFISDFYYAFNCANSSHLAIVKNIFRHWEELFRPVEDIRSYIKLKLLVELSPLSDLDSYVLKLASLFNELVNEFGILGIVDCFSSTLGYSLPDHIFRTDNVYLKRYNLALKLVELEDSSFVKLLAIDLLPQDILDNNEGQQMLTKLIQILKNSDDNTVKVNLDLFITSLN